MKTRWSIDGLEVGSILGFPLLIQNSLVNASVVIFVAWPLADSGSTMQLVGKLIFLPLLVLSVLAHELGHALTARSLGIPVRRIALTLYGGYAEFWVPPQRPGHEALVAFAGPATNLLIAAALFPLVWWGTPLPEPLWDVLILTFSANVGLGIFNLAPGLPLDGGHLLRSALSVKMSRGRAGWISAWCGVVVGVIVVLAGYLRESAWTFCIGVFLIFSASALLKRMRYD